MEITVSGKHLEITEAIRAYAQEKAGKLSKFFNHIQSIEVIADTSRGNYYEIEMIVHVGRHDPFIATTRGENLYATIDQTQSKLERQLTDHKEKVKNHKHNPAR